MIELKDIPSSLFKYRDFNEDKNYKELILNNTLYFSSPKNFNDPFDCRVYPDYESGSREEIKSKFYDIIKNQNPLLTEKKWLVLTERAFKKNYQNIKSPSEMIKTYNNILDKFFGICSFAECNNNLLMWAHYSNSHQGFCVEFDAHLLYQIGSNYLKYCNELMHFYKIKYETAYPAINPYIKGANDLLDWITTKSLDWNYEREWRLIYFNHPNIAVKFPDNIIKSVYFGVNCSEDKMTNCIQMLMHKKPRPELYKSELKHREFGIVFRKVSY